MTASNYLLRRIQRLALATILALGMSPFASAGETITFFHNDVAGSPALATDTNGLIAWKETYRPYGERVIQATASTSNDLWFTGKSHDETTGLTYMGARYYDPFIGRFTGIDPAAIDFENPHGLNRFAYANNNPYKFVDPDGRLPVFVIPLIIKAIDIAFTAHDVYTAAQQGGAAGVAKVAAENAVLSAVPGGKIGSKIVDAVRKADVPSAADDVAGSVYHYTDDATAELIERSQLGLPGRTTYLTPNGSLSPTQAGIELALPQGNTGRAVFEVSTDALDASKISRVGRVTGNVNSRGGGGTEILYEGAIPREAFRRVR